MRSPRSVPTAPQPRYPRMRENPFFDGLLRGDDALTNPAPTSVLQGSAGTGRRSISRATSDVGDTRGRRVVSASSEKVMEVPLEETFSEMVLDPLGRSSSARFSKLAKTSSFSLPSFQSDSSSHLGDPNDVETTTRTDEASEDGLPGLGRPILEKSYSVRKRKSNLLQIPLPLCAASFYRGYSQETEIVESCESISRLNHFLKSRRDYVNAGVPGRFLHAVMGQDVSDVASVASVIMYAFYLHQTLKSDQLCIVPVINMRRKDLSSRAELKWLLDSCQIDQHYLIFIDEIDLSYYDLFGSLKLVLLNGHKLPTKQEALKDAVVEIFNCRKVDSASYPWVETVTVEEDCSCCTVVAEKFALTSPEILSGQGFSRLLLAGILLDTANLTDHHCTSKDKYISTLLINGAGRFGCDGLYQILRYKMYDVSGLKIVDVLRKDFKKWTRVGNPDAAGSRAMVSHIGMSSIGVSVGQLLSHQENSTQEIKHFQQSEKLRLLMIVSGYYDAQKNFKREILVSGESADLMKNLLYFFNMNASQLPLKVVHQPGLREEMKVFEVDKVTSRKTIEHLLEEFGGISKGKVNKMGY